MPNTYRQLTEGMPAMETARLVRDLRKLGESPRLLDSWLYWTPRPAVAPFGVSANPDFHYQLSCAADRTYPAVVIPSQRWNTAQQVGTVGETHTIRIVPRDDTPYFEHRARGNLAWVLVLAQQMAEIAGWEFATPLAKRH